MKTYLNVIRDHSGSMHSIRKAAARDYNSTISATQRAASVNNIETVASVIICDSVPQRDHSTTLVPIGSVKLLPENGYAANGSTPLFGSVLLAIDDLKKVADYNDPEVTFIVFATTDGAATDRQLAPEVARSIAELQNTDRWTFVFRVPRGQAKTLISMGIAEGNILEWDQTDRGVAAATQASDQAFSEFYSNRAAGVKSTRTFYTSLKDVTAADVKAVLKDISGEVSLFPVAAVDEGKQIRDYVEARLGGAPMAKGAAFYQLVKVEDKIQGYKLIGIRDKKTNAIYCGEAARDMLGLPRNADARVRPEISSDFDVFIQSTSVNRKVNAGTQIMYWPNVGIAFKEGKSAR